MLSLSHLVIIIIAALIFLGPDKIPQFLKSCAEGIVGFKKIINNSDFLEEKSNNINKKKKKNKENNKDFKSKKKTYKNFNNKPKKNL